MKRLLAALLARIPLDPAPARTLPDPMLDPEYVAALRAKAIGEKERRAAQARLLEAERFSRRTAYSPTGVCR